MVSKMTMSVAVCTGMTLIWEPHSEVKITCHVISVTQYYRIQMRASSLLISTCAFFLPLCEQNMPYRQLYIKCATFTALHNTCTTTWNMSCVSDVQHDPACSCTVVPPETERARDTWIRSRGLTMCCCSRPGELVSHNTPLTVCVIVWLCWWRAEHPVCVAGLLAVCHTARVDPETLCAILSHLKPNINTKMARLDRRGVSGGWI